MVGVERTLPRPLPAAARRSGADRSFHLIIALVVALVVLFGFGRNLDQRLFHARSPRPPILYVHVAIFTAWVVLYAAQAALVRVRRVWWHRRLGAAGIAIGALMPTIGVWTALVMARLHRAEHGRTVREDLLLWGLPTLVVGQAIAMWIYLSREPTWLAIANALLK